MASPKTHGVEKAKARSYLAKANEFLAASKTAAANGQDDAALLLAVHSGIGACDAVTIALASLRSADPDHLRAADLLETIAARADEIHGRANQLRSLLKMKNLVEYEDNRASAAQAQDGTKRAARLAEWAGTQLARARV
ncbi:MAG: hypothetical protein M3T56_16945 [Chloroflexota bacterium]|nr:hypothetical protein [Chloroflexota bacterium]